MSFVIVIALISCNSNSNSTVTHNLISSVSPTEAGSITPSQGEFESGEQVEVTATPNENWVFVEWDGDLSGTTNPTTFTIEKNTTINAVFQRKPYPLTINIEGDGNVTENIVQAKTTEYPYGSLVEITAEPGEGWKFVEWQGDITGSQNPAEINIDDEKTVTAIFQRREFILTVDVEGGGSVKEFPSQPKTTNYLYGTIVELLAQPDEGWSFIEWQGDLTGDQNPSEITIDGDKNVTTSFEYGFNEDFQNDNNGMWITTQHAAITNGVLRIEGPATDSDSWHGAYYNKVMPNNFRAEFEFSRISPDRSRNTIALWYAISNSFNNFYQVGFTQSGTQGFYQVQAINDDGVSDLIDWTEGSSIINIKSGEINRIVLNVAEGQADIFINGTYVGSFQGDLLDGGFIGFYTYDGDSNEGGGQNIVIYDNISITMPNDPVAKAKIIPASNEKTSLEGPAKARANKQY